MDMGSTRTDRELLACTRDGDAQAFGCFFDRRHTTVLAFLRPRVRDSELAADLMCETFASALIAVHDSRRELPLEPVAWLITIAHHELLDGIRRGKVAERARRRLGLEPLELEDRHLAAVEDASADTDLMGRLRAELPADQLRALTDRVLLERDYREIAEELDCSQAVVRKRVSRALSTLRANRGVGV
jgi:RNA polymerase sigma factor (sigma-70 family)